MPHLRSKSATNNVESSNNFHFYVNLARIKMQKIAILLLISVFSISVLSAGEKSMDFNEFMWIN
jgi:hypothetical protein